MSPPKTQDSPKVRWIARLVGCEGLNSYLARGLSGTFFISVVGKGMAFVTAIVLARLMGPANLGVYAMALAVAQLLRLPSAMGLPGLVVRYVSAYEAQERWDLLRGLLRRTSQITLILSTVVAIIGSAVVWALNNRLGPEKSAALWIALWMIPLLDGSGIRGAALQGLRRVVLAQIPDVLVRPVLFLVLVGIAWKFTGSALLTPMLTIGLYFVAVAVPFALGIVLLFRAVPAIVWKSSFATDYTRWRGSLLPFMLLHTSNLLVSQIDTLMLSAFSTDSSVGLYRVAWQGGEVISFALVIVNIVIQPMISRLYTQGDYARLQRMVTLTARLVAAITFPLALFLIILGPWLLPLIFGSAYQASYPPMAILIAGQLINVAAGSVGLLLFMTGHESDAARAIGLAAVINVVLDWVLIPYFGVEGAAVASTVSLMGWNVYLFRRVRRRLGIDPTVFGRRL